MPLRWLLIPIVACLSVGCHRPAAVPNGQIRVVSLAPSLTEIVCAVGGREYLVGRTSACNFPPEVLQVPVIGGFGVPSMERVLAASPTLVLDVALEDKSMAQKMQNLGLHRVNLRCRSLDDVPRAMEEAAVLLQTTEQARDSIAGLRQGIQTLRTQALQETNRPSVYVEIWHDPLTTVGTNTYLSELIALAGGRNIGDSVSRDYFQVSSEWIVRMNPDIILCLYMSNEGSARQRVPERPGWSGIAAVTNQAIHDGLNHDVLLRPGPRVLEGIDQLKAIMRKPGAP